MNAVVQKVICQWCGYDWYARTAKPKKCPNPDCNKRHPIKEEKVPV